MAETAEAMADLYESDETAWLESMAQLIAGRKYRELDFAHLQEYLTDMAKRDKRAVISRLTVLLAHLLKWENQPDKRTPSWRATIIVQRRDLKALLDSRVLRKHAQAGLATAFEDAVEQAMAETSMLESEFPKKCPWTIEMLMSEDLLGKRDE